MTTTQERPILFSGPLVREILAGRKTMTRRPVKDAWKPGIDRHWMACVPERAASVCPYGAPGDRLWVRETWQAIRVHRYEAGDQDIDTANPIPRERGPWSVAFAADPGPSHKDDRGFSWRPGIHMPRWASRLLLEVTAVRVERLWEITEEDAIAEGLHSNAIFPWAREAFASKWREIYGGESWDANPWLWVITFKRITVETAR